MTQLAPTSAQIRAQVAAIREKSPSARVIGIRSPASLDLGETLRVGEVEFTVARCQSVLDVRERLTAVATGGGHLVLLTELPEVELGQDALARIAKRHLFTIDPWQLVKQRFQARYVDPSLVRGHPWLARTLLDIEPSQGFPPAPSGFLQAGTVWHLLFESLLGLPNGDRDPQALLRWSLDSTGQRRLLDLDDEVREGLKGAVADSAGPLAAMIFDHLTRHPDNRVMAIGLSARVLFGEAARGDATATKAQGKLEALLGQGELNEQRMLAWADAAESVLSSQLVSQRLGAVRPVLSTADAFLSELSATECAYRSRFLKSGFEQRLATFGTALKRYITGRAQQIPTPLLEAIDHALDHVLANHETARAERVLMAARLSGWISSRRQSTHSEPNTLAAAANRYCNEGAFVDWARTRIQDGDPVSELASAYSALSKAADKAREAENHSFGQLLARWTALGSHDDGTLQLEEVLNQIAVPLARADRILVLVVDGMGVATFRELQNDLLHRGWVEIVEGGQPSGRPIIAAIPTVTEVCRASLLCGKLTSGSSALEKKGFASHEGLRAAGEKSKPPKLYHKGDLRQEGVAGLSPDVLGAIEDVRQRVVGVVINGVDDHLSKGEQVRVDWNAHRIRPLEELLSAAADTGRCVVLVSDHGHVLEHNTRERAGDDAERWRLATGALHEDEVLLEGPRVVLGESGRLIAPWSERVRYTGKKNGYHGGASPQEIMIPLGVYAVAGLSVEGWQEAGADLPDWWQRREVTSKPPAKRPSRLVKPAPPRQVGETGRLFPTPDEEAAGTTAEVDWIDRLLSSDRMRAQRKAAARTALHDERIRAVLLALDERGGKLTRSALASRLKVAPLRIGGVISALRRVLNVDGCAVLSVDETSDTVTLNRESLNIQFGLD